MTPLTLLSEIARTAGLDQAGSERAAGLVLGAIKMSTRKDVYAPLEQAIPNAQTLILKAGPALGGGRTGEIVAFVSELRTPEGVKGFLARVAKQGLTEEQVRATLGRILEQVRTKQGDGPITALLEALPALRELGA